MESSGVHVDYVGDGKVLINSSKQCQKKTGAACRDAGCKQRDSCKGGNGVPVW